MATVIDQFLVGIGFEPDEAGARAAEGSLNSIRSSALQLGAVVGTGLGLKALTVDFANAADEAGKFSEIIGVSVEDMDRLDFAIQREGGSLNELKGELRSIDQFREGLAVGDVGFLAQAEAAGISTDALIKAKNPMEAYLALAEQFQNLDRGQKVNAAQALGLGDASVRLLSRGRKGIQEYIDEADRLGTQTTEMTEVAKDFNDSLTDTQRIFGSIGDTISVNFLPFLTDANKEMSDFLANNKELIDSGIEEAADGMAGSIAGITASITALTAAAGASGLASLLSKLGLSGTARGVGGIAAGARAAGGLGLAASGGFAVGSVISDNLSNDFNQTFGRGIARWLSFFGNDEATRSLTAERSFLDSRANTTINFNPQQSDIQTMRRVVNEELTNVTTQTQQDIITSDEG